MDILVRPATVGEEFNGKVAIGTDFVIQYPDGKTDILSIMELYNGWVLEETLVGWQRFRSK